LIVDYGAAMLWGFSGALVAVRRRLDIVGVAVLALVTALGGSILRDGLFLQVHPVALVYPWYLPAIAFAAILTAILRGRIGMLTQHRTVDTLDAIGMGAYAVIGMEKAMAVGYPPAGVVLVGMVNAVGGGILRDILVSEVPSLFTPSQFYSLPVLAGCIVFWTLVHFQIVSTAHAAWLTMFLVLAGRTLAIRFDWRTKPVAGDEDGGEVSQQ
jgi:uncharacterized membrane protein YeiH